MRRLTRIFKEAKIAHEICLSPEYIHIDYWPGDSDCNHTTQILEDAVAWLEYDYLNANGAPVQHKMPESVRQARAHLLGAITRLKSHQIERRN